MQPLLNYIPFLIDKYIYHIPDEHKEAFRKDIGAIGEFIKAETPLIVEAGAKGAVEGAKSK